MPEQMLLPGVEPKPVLTDRLIFVVLPGREAVDQIERCRSSLRNQYSLRRRSIIRDRLHVTLHHVGDFPGFPQDFVTAISNAASRVAMNSFNVVFDQVMSFSGKSGHLPLVLIGSELIEGLIGLQRALIVELQCIGLSVSINKYFTPHITLLYDGRKIDKTIIEPVVWNVREFALVHSQIGKNRPYTVLGRWPLRS